MEYESRAAEAQMNILQLLLSYPVLLNFNEKFVDFVNF